jgi:hypothetical protein
MLKLLDTAGRPDAFKGPSGRLHKNRLLTWKLHGIFMNIFQKLVINHMNWNEHCPYYMKTLNRNRSSCLKCNLYIKCFCHPECSQHKILTNMSIHVEQNHIKIRRCLKKLDLEDDDEDDWVLWLLIFWWFMFSLNLFLFGIYFWDNLRLFLFFWIIVNYVTVVFNTLFTLCPFETKRWSIFNF